MDDIYENVDHPTHSQTVPGPELYETSMPAAANSFQMSVEAAPEPAMYDAPIPLAVLRSQMPLPTIPNEVQATSVFQTRTAETDQDTRYRGVCRQLPVENEQQPQRVESKTEVSSQDIKKNASSRITSKIVFYTLPVLAIALSVVVLVLLFVMGNKEEIESMNTIIKNLQSKYTDQTLDIRNMSTIIESQHAELTSQKSEIKSLTATNEILQSKYENQTLEMKNMEALIKDVKENYTALNTEAQSTSKRLIAATNTISTLQSTTVQSIETVRDEQSEKLATMQLELTKLNTSFNHYSAHPVRLAGSSSSSSRGRVEIFMYGSWGTVCDDGWGINDGHVVCKQLGFSRASRVVTQASDFGQGSGNIWLDNVACTGEERHLTYCRYVMNENCGHSEDAGVYCV